MNDPVCIKCDVPLSKHVDGHEFKPYRCGRCARTLHGSEIENLVADVAFCDSCFDEFCDAFSKVLAAIEG
jgi:hypothetical protein